MVPKGANYAKACTRVMGEMQASWPGSRVAARRGPCLAITLELGTLLVIFRKDLVSLSLIISTNSNLLSSGRNA